MSKPTDSELVAATLEGSQADFGRLVRRYERPVLGLILRMVRNRAIAEDLAQETFFKAYSRLASYDTSRRFSSWLFKVAHNTTIDHLRRRQLATVPLEATGEDDMGLEGRLEDSRSEGPEDRAARGELARALEVGMAKLRPQHREVLLLRFRHGLSYEELAEVTGLPLGTVKTHLFRARRRLAKLLEEQGWKE